MQQRAVAFMARSVARHHAQLGMVALLDLPVRIALPPVGLINAARTAHDPGDGGAGGMPADEARLLAQ